MNDLLKRIVDYRLFAFLVIAIESGVLAFNDKLASADLKLVLIADIGAFIGAQAWERVKGATTTPTPTTTPAGD